MTTASPVLVVLGLGAAAEAVTATTSARVAVAITEVVGEGAEEEPEAGEAGEAGAAAAVAAVAAVEGSLPPPRPRLAVGFGSRTAKCIMHTGREPSTSRLDPRRKPRRWRLRNRRRPRRRFTDSARGVTGRGSTRTPRLSYRRRGVDLEAEAAEGEVDLEEGAEAGEAAAAAVGGRVTRTRIRIKPP